MLGPVLVLRRLGILREQCGMECLARLFLVTFLLFLAFALRRIIKLIELMDLLHQNLNTNYYLINFISAMNKHFN